MSWQLVHLGNHIDLLSGFAFKSELFNSAGDGLPLVRIRDVISGKSETYYSGEYSQDFLLQNGDMLIGMDGDFNRAYWSGGKALLNQRVCKITAKKSTLDQSYLYHFLPKALAKIHAATPAVTVKHLSVNGIRAIEIPLPPLEEQKRIAAILDKADAIRRKRQQAIKLADEFLRAVFLDMFGDPVTNPKGWNKRQLGELIKLSSGNGLTAKEMSSNGDYLVYGGNGVNGKHSEFMFENPQLIIGRVGVYCGVVHITKPFSWVTDNALYIKEYLQEIDVDFLAMLLEIMNLNQYAGQAAQPLISGGRIYPLEAILPPLELQKKFSAIKDRFNLTLNILNESYDRSEKCFLSLSQKSFSGSL